MKNLILFIALFCPIMLWSTPVLEDTYELWFSVGDVQHHALLRKVEGGWEMRVRFYDAKCQCEQLIQEKFDVEKNASGLKLRGHSVSGLSRTLEPGRYNADSFYLYFRSNGSIYASNIDEAGEMVNMNIQAVKQPEASQKFQYFQWKDTSR